MNQDASRATRMDVAIVGTACRLPGANSPQELWMLLREYRDAITGHPSDRVKEGRYFDPHAMCNRKMPTIWGGFVSNIDHFDPSVFSISSTEANAIDPQQRLLLEVTWEALENACITPDSLGGSRTGVFVGIAGFDYVMQRCLADPYGESIDAFCGTGSAHSIAANRLSYVLDLKGPSLAIDTACSSSLIALHMALRSLEHGESDMAVVGGVNAILTPHASIAFSQARMLSPDGRCKSFDADANGYVRSEGCVVIVIKKLQKAMADGDRVLGVIRGSAANQDGRTTGIVAPSQSMQESVIRDALEIANVKPDVIQFVAAHGTGTKIGDTVELNALSSVFVGDRSMPCYVGSIKANIGHSETAAGLASLLSVLLCFQHEEIPGQINIQSLNSAAEGEGSRIVVPTSTVPWPKGDSPRIAGVSSFGFGGTNAHIILQEAPKSIPVTQKFERPLHILSLSAKKPDVLNEVVRRLSDALDSGRVSESVANIGYSGNIGRTHFPYRAAFLARTRADLSDQLRNYSTARESPFVMRGEMSGASPRIGLLFSGQGAQFPGMGAELFRAAPLFHRILCDADCILREKVKWSLLELLYGDDDDFRNQIGQTALTQPALFAVEYALAQLWLEWGIEPTAVLGHSLGEYVAACVAGVFSFEEGLNLVAERGRLMGSIEESGAMLAVAAKEEEITRMLEGFEDRVSIAAVNAPESVVISGAKEPLLALAERIEARGWKTRRLNVSHAFHSPLMGPIISQFKQEARKIEFKRPTIQLISNVTGEPLEVDQIPGVRHWTAHMHKPVRFWDGYRALLNSGIDTVIEVSPHPVLLTALHGAQVKNRPRFITSLSKGRDAWRTLLEGFGTLYVSGSKLDWAGFDRGYSRVKVDLPTYPFGRAPYWFSVAENKAAAPSVGLSQLTVGNSANLLCGTSTGNDVSTTFQLTDWASTGRLLEEHRIRGISVVPATVYLELMLSAAEVMGVDTGGLCKVRFLRPLTFEKKDPATLQLTITLLPDGDRLLQVHRTIPDNSSASVLASAMISPKSPCSEPCERQKVPLQKIEDRLDQSLGMEELYDSLREAGLNYGPSFRHVRSVRFNGNEALALLSTPDDVNLRTHYCRIDPVFLDACLHPIAVILGRSMAAADCCAWIPVSLDRFRIRGERPTGPLLTYVRRSTDLQMSSQPSFDVTVLGDDGWPWLELQGLHLQRLRNTERGTEIEHGKSPLFQLVWEPRSNCVEQPDGKGQMWFVIPLRARFVRDVVDGLKRTGANVETAEALSGGDVSIKAFSSRLTDAGEQPVGIVLLFGESEMGPTDTDYCQKLLGFVQAFPKSNSIHRLCIVTTGIAPVTGALTPDGVGQSMLCGMARTIQREYPNWGCALLDLPKDPTEQDIGNLAREIIGGQPNEQVAFCNGQEFVLRLTSERSSRESRRDVDQSTDFRLDVAETIGPQGIRLVAARPRCPGPDQVLIKPVAMGLNFRDVMKSLGLYPETPQTPTWLGDECAGLVDECGANIRNLRPGDEVLCIAPAAFASHVLADARLVTLKPDRLSFEEAATIPIAFSTAWHALVDLARLQRGERILIHSAAGGVGQAAVQVAKMLGAEIFGTSGSPDKRRYLSEIGIEHVLDSSTVEFADEVLEITDGEGVDVVLNTLVGLALEAGLGVLKPFGRFIEIGKRSIFENSHIGLRPFEKSLTFCSVDMERLFATNFARDECILTTVVKAVESGGLQPLPYTTFKMNNVQAAFQHLIKRKSIGKIVLVNNATPKSESDTRNHTAKRNRRPTHSDCYLVTGGLGTLGLTVAEWLAQRGDRSIVILASRGSPTPTATAKIAALRELGCDVRAVRMDVADRISVARVLNELGDEGVTLRGVVHAAGVLDDRTLKNLDKASLEAVLKPKVLGGWTLHELTLDQDLEFFICFSSIAAVFGSPGQANYAAANAFLDSLCHYRRTLGLPACSINWGPWSVGMGGTNRTVQRLTHFGFTVFSPIEGLQILDEIASRNLTQTVAVSVDWKKVGAAWSGFRVPPIFATLQQAGSADKSDQQVSVQATEASDGRDQYETGECKEAVFEFLKEQILAFTVHEGSEVSTSTTLGELGVDSLVELELMLVLEAKFGVTFSPDSIGEDTSLADLVDVIMDLTIRNGQSMASENYLRSAHATTEGDDSPVAVSKDEHQLSPEDSASLMAETNSPRRSLPVVDPLAYGECIRPDFVGALRAAKLDVEFTWARGDRMRGSYQGQPIEVIDMLGGFGSTLFGHNHPELVSVAKQVLDAARTMHAQISNRTAAGELAKTLSNRVSAVTGDRYVAILGSTGGEIIDAAMKHALFEWSARQTYARCARTPNAGTLQVEGLGLDTPPCFLAIEGGYHGKTLGADSLTWQTVGVERPALRGPARVHWIHRNDIADFERILELTTTNLTRDDGNDLRWSAVAGIFVEPIQGEGGIRPLDATFMRAIRARADELGFPLIIDEIQTGLGRCGAFLVSSLADVRGDYYTFGKALGGGIAKISALLIKRDRYQQDFGFAHTSTFAEDDLSAFVGLEALRLLEEDSISERCAIAGKYLLDSLAEMKAAFPNVLADVRGAGLLVGVEFRDQRDSTSGVLRALCEQQQFGYVIAGHMLHCEGVRVGCTLSAPLTLRLEPSAYISNADLDKTIRALRHICQSIDLGDSAYFLRYLVDQRGRPKLSSKRQLETGPTSTRRVANVAVETPGPKVVFLGHILDENALLNWDPSLSEFTSEERQELLKRMTTPISIMRTPLHALSGDTIDFHVMALCLTSNMIHNMLTDGAIQSLQKLVADAVRHVVAEGASVVGLGGLLSVATRSGVNLSNAAVRVTTGNSYTVAIGVDAMLRAAQAHDVDLSSISFGAVGAAGNICSTIVRLMSEHVERLILVGRPPARARLLRVAEQIYEDAYRKWNTVQQKTLSGVAAALANTPILRRVQNRIAKGETQSTFGALIRAGLIEMYGHDPFVTIAQSPEALAECELIVTASSTPRPVIYADHLGPRPHIICDIAIPPDVDRSVLVQRKDVIVIRGGVVRAPGENDFVVEFTRLPKSHMFACMAEAAILGFEGKSNDTSIGDLDLGTVKRIKEAADRAGFCLGYLTTEKSLGFE